MVGYFPLFKKDANPRTLNELDRLRREVAAVDGQVRVVVVLQDWEDGVADAAAELQDRPRRRVRQLREFSEQPVPIFEEPVLESQNWSCTESVNQRKRQTKNGGRVSVLASHPAALGSNLARFFL